MDNKNKVDAGLQNDTLPKFVEKLKRNESQTINLILVSGIPGSGKGRLANSLTNYLGNELVNTAAFKMPSV